MGYGCLSTRIELPERLNTKIGGQIHAKVHPQSKSRDSIDIGDIHPRRRAIRRWRRYGRWYGWKPDVRTSRHVQLKGCHHWGNRRRCSRWRWFAVLEAP